MKQVQFKSYCPYEIGDKVLDIDGNKLVIEDIRTVHYLKTGIVEFEFNFGADNDWHKINYIKGFC